MTTARDIMERAAILLNDTGFVRWTLAELCTWLNEAQLAVVLAKPSALSRSRVVTLSVGTWQQIATPDGEPKRLALLDITRNLTAATPNRVGGRVIKPVSRQQLDAQNPNWHSTSAVAFSATVKHFTYDEQNPLEYYVYPGNDGTGMVEAVLSEQPALIEADGAATELASYETEIDLPEPYSVPIVDYVCSRAYAKDAPQGVSARANDHYAKFAAAVGLKIQVEGSSSPNNRRGGP